MLSEGQYCFNTKRRYSTCTKPDTPDVNSRSQEGAEEEEEMEEEEEALVL
jgi:hypothetical protein